MKPIAKQKTAQTQKLSRKTKIEPKRTIAKLGGEPHTALRTGTLKIGDIELTCAVLDDGTRLLSQRAMSVALGRYKNPRHSGEQVDDVPVFLAAKNLEPFLSDELRDKWQPIPYYSQGGLGGNVAFGYRAEILPMVCAVYLDAMDAGALRSAQDKSAAAAKILFRAFAHVGIIALVDEATGYQEDRLKDDLQQIIKQFISDELSKWVKTFPDEYYRELFKLHGMSYNQFTTRRPIVIGKLTKDLVYDRLAPNVTEALEGKNPKDEKGRRKDKHHQWLTPEIGQQKLREHLASLIALFKASGGNKAMFKRLVNRALPRWKDTLQGTLPGTDED